MPRTAVDTRAEIRAAALEKFGERGVEQTSLREIAEGIGITKAALYYHYASKDALLADLVEPMLDDLRALGDALESGGGPVTGDDARREALARFYDLCFAHRQVMRVLIHNPHVVGRTEIAPRMVRWRGRIDAALVGDTLDERVRAVVALGGLQDAVVLFDPQDRPAVREAALDAASRALSAGAPR